MAAYTHITPGKREWEREIYIIPGPFSEINCSIHQWVQTMFVNYAYIPCALHMQCHDMGMACSIDGRFFEKHTATRIKMKVCRAHIYAFCNISSTPLSQNKWNLFEHNLRFPLSNFQAFGTFSESRRLTAWSRLKAMAASEPHTGCYIWLTALDHKMPLRWYDTKNSTGTFTSM